MPSGEIVTPDIRDAERLQGFRKGWTAPAEQAVRGSYRWKLVGNAVSVPVAEWIGEQLARPASVASLVLPGVRPLSVGSPWPKAAWNVGDGRFATSVSAWPCRRKRRDLHEFLVEEPKPLSPRATRGFLNRTDKSSLRFPLGFLDAVKAHLARVAS